MMTLKRWILILMAGLLLSLTACNAATANTAVTAVPTTAALVEMATAEPTTAVVEAVTNAPEVATATEAVATAVEVTAVTNSKLNLNQATGDEYLSTIPDFGNRMVREFLEYRPYTSILQFRREIGKYVSDEQIAFYEQYVYVPVNVDESDAATLQQIPGIDAAAADALIAARPYGSNEAFLAKLADYLSTDQLAVAAGYLETP